MRSKANLEQLHAKPINSYKIKLTINKIKLYIL